jgi:CRP-like cAMP-binding protein
MEQYMKVLKSLKRFPRTLEDKLRENVKPILFKTGDIIQWQGKYCRHLYFIEKGLVRIFYTTKGNEQVHGFKKENDFIIGHIVPEDGSEEFAYCIEALEDTMLWDFPEELVASLSRESHKFLLIHSTILMKDMAHLNGASNLHPYHTSNWFDYLRQNCPQLLDRVPVKYLASFIGVSEKVFLHMKDSSLKMGVVPKKPVRRRTA